jgi:hypothetical protein
MRLKVAAILLALGLSSPALAQTTFLANPGSTTPFRFGTDGASKLFGNGAICDGAACAVLASVNPAGTPGTNGLAVQGLTGGVPLAVVLMQGGSVLSSSNPIFASLAGSTLPAFAATPTFNLGTLNGAATAANQLPSSASSAATSTCSSTAMEASHICKASAGNLYGFYCNVVGGAAGWCIAYNSTTVPGSSLTGAQVLDSCQFAAGAMGCSLDRIPFPRQYGTGIVILVSTAANPFTFTTGTDTAYISADYQ